MSDSSKPIEGRSQTDVTPAEGVEIEDLRAQHRAWIAQSASVPNLPGKKDETVAILHELLTLVAEGPISNFAAHPNLNSIELSKDWRYYRSLLNALGLTQSSSSGLELTSEGTEYLSTADPKILANLLARRIRVVAESLGLLVEEPRSVKQVHNEIVASYRLPWGNVANVRNRLTWLEILGATEWLGGGKMQATEFGRQLYAGWSTVSPEAVGYEDDVSAPDIVEAPIEIQALLDALASEPEKHLDRATYNIWVPSPKSDPNKIDNMKIAIGAAVDPIEKSVLLQFIADRFGLKRSSVDSMLPFMRAAGFLQEKQRGVFVATTAAKAWIDSGDDLNFIRILHSHMRFVGELLLLIATSTPRSDVYAHGTSAGLNTDKVRWLISFLEDAGLLIQTSWSSVQATKLGLAVSASLPLADLELWINGSAAALDEPSETTQLIGRSEPGEPQRTPAMEIAEGLERTALDPAADNGAPGSAFEDFIQRAFAYMGFESQRISGSGDTDVLVKWRDSGGLLRVGIVDGKSTSSGKISHNNVSDIALETHKEKHAADYVAIVAPAFSGDTIRNTASARNWSLIAAGDLGRLVHISSSFGLRPWEIATVLDGEQGKAELEDLVRNREREREVIATVLTRLREEAQAGEALSARDISLIERKSDLNPAVDEIVDVLGTLTGLDPAPIRIVESSPDPRHTSYELSEVLPAVRRLRSLANALQGGAAATDRS